MPRIVLWARCFLSQAAGRCAESALPALHETAYAYADACALSGARFTSVTWLTNAVPTCSVRRRAVDLRWRKPPLVAGVVAQSRKLLTDAGGAVAYSVRMKNEFSRRDLIKSLTLVSGVALMTARSGRSAAADAVAAPHLPSADPLAIALSYFENASKVDATKFPTYRPEQKCANCQQLQGKVGDLWRPCNLFPGKLVSASGWCKVYVKKA